MVNEQHLTGAFRQGAAARAIRYGGAAILAAALAFSIISPGAAAPSPGDDGFGRDLRNLFDHKQSPRDRALDAFSREIEAGVTDLRLHYMKGGDWPPPPAIAIEFLLLRGADLKRPDLTDLALGTAAIYASMRVADFVNTGHQVSPGVFEKKPVDQAGILSMLSLAWRASGKDALKTAALRVGDDLAAQVAKPAALTTPGEQARVAAALLEGGVVFARPAWLKAGRAIPLKPGTLLKPGRGGDDLRKLEAARVLLASIEASPGRSEKSWPAVAPRLAGELGSDPRAHATAGSPPKSAADPVSSGWSALALMQFGAFTHDDSARAAAIRIFDRLAPPAAAPKERDPGLFAAQAAAAMAAELYLHPAPMAYIVADPRSTVTDSLVQAAVRANRPGRLVSVHSPKETDLLYPADSDGKPIVYVCSGELCAPPTASPADVKALVETFALPEAAGDENPGAGRSPE